MCTSGFVKGKKVTHYEDGTVVLEFSGWYYNEYKKEFLKAVPLEEDFICTNTNLKSKPL